MQRRGKPTGVASYAGEFPVSGGRKKGEGVRAGGLGRRGREGLTMGRVRLRKGVGRVGKERMRWREDGVTEREGREGKW